MNLLKQTVTFAFLVICAIPVAVFADEYKVTIAKDARRLIKVSALVEPDGDEIGMNEEGVHGLKEGWATFVENIKATDLDGRIYEVTALKNSRWRLVGFKTGKINLEYVVLLKHDQVNIEFGDNGAAYATPDGVMWAGRALFIAGKPTSDVVVKFDVPKNWKITTPWKNFSQSPYHFRIRGTDDLVNSAFFAGIHTAFEITVGGVTLRLALSGKNTLKMREQIVQRIRRYLDYYGQVFPSETESEMLFIAADRSYWGGEVMGRAISVSIGEDLPEGLDPLSTLSHVIAHELFHVFSRARIEIDSVDEKAARFEWFNEGFGAEHATWTARLRLGEVTVEEFLSEMVNQNAKYQAKLDGKLTLISAGEDKAANYDIVYSGGLMAAVSLDFLIRSETENKKSVDDLWAYLLKRYPRGGDSLTFAKLSEAVTHLYGEPVAKIFENYIDSPNEIPFYANSELMGLKFEHGKLAPMRTASDKQKLVWRRFSESSRSGQK